MKAPEILSSNLPARPRAYTKEFGKHLLSLWKEETASGTPRLCMRQKVHVSQAVSDKELFNSLSLGDTWPDGDLGAVWGYLWRNKKLLVPLSWQSTMEAFNEEVQSSVPNLQEDAF